MLEILKADILGRLAFDNPWWASPTEKIAFEQDPRRKYFEPFYKVVIDKSVRRAIVLMGPRRVGKTVLLYHTIKRLILEGSDPRTILYVSLETPLYTGLSLEKILGLFQEQFSHGREHSLHIFFDEIQYLKDWEIHLKSLVDSYPAYKFVATGSAAAALRLKSNESGAGRFSDFMLPPLTFAEYLSFIGRESELINQREEKTTKVEGADVNYPSYIYEAKDVNALNEEFVRYLNYGGYPEAVFSETIRKDPGQYIKSDIIDKVLLRDLPSLYGISDIQELNRLFTTLAYNTGNEVSLEALSRSSGVAKNTIRRYLEYLEAAFLIKTVERIDHTAKRFKRAMSFKVYLTNPSMRAALFGQMDPDSPAMGALTETAVFSQWQHSATELFYARWSDGEIDIVCLLQQKPMWAVEVKWSDRPYQARAELDNCVEFVRQHPRVSQPILVTSKTVHDDLVVYKDVRFQFRPSSLYTYSLGANLLRTIQAGVWSKLAVMQSVTQVSAPETVITHVTTPQS